MDLTRLKNSKLDSVVVFLILLGHGSLSGCLRTRAQIRDGDTDSNPHPTSVRPVEYPVAYKDAGVIDEIKLEMTKMSGRLDELERVNQGGSSRYLTTEESKKLETRIVELERAQALMIENLKKLQDTVAQSNELDVFAKGKGFYESKKYSEAIEVFSQYLKNPKASRIDEATFLRAESFFNVKQYNKAIVDYSIFTEKDPPSKFLLRSLYKIGLSLESLGMKKESKEFYQDLVERFPKSAEAKEVRPKLKVDSKKSKPKKSKT